MAARSHPGADTSEAAGSPAGAARLAEGPETAPRAAPAALPAPAPAPAAGPCSEELVLTCTFEACDPEQTGKVPVSRIMEYLQAVTGRGGEEGRLRALRGMLDPGGTGAALDLATFHAVMTAWIADCRRERGAERAAERDGSADDAGVPPPEQGGGPAPPAAQLEGYGGDAERPGAEEAAALAGLVEDLDCSNRRLATENAALRSAAESAEELNARLAEEVAGLRGRLRGARQALGQAEAAARELDDLKAVAERLEEANAELRAQLRQLERERQGLLARAGGLREENEKLQAEGERARQRIRALAAEKADLEARLRQREELLSRGEAALVERTRQAEELRASLEQHRHAVQELRREAAGLREQLGRTRDASAAPPWGPRGDADADTNAGGPAQPLCAEIEATRQGAAADAGLPSPLCGRTPEPCRAAQGADGDGSAEPPGAPAGTQPRQRRSPERWDGSRPRPPPLPLPRRPGSPGSSRIPICATPPGPPTLPGRDKALQPGTRPPLPFPSHPAARRRIGAGRSGTDVRSTSGAGPGCPQPLRAQGRAASWQHGGGEASCSPKPPQNASIRGPAANPEPGPCVAARPGTSARSGRAGAPGAPRSEPGRCWRCGMPGTGPAPAPSASAHRGRRLPQGPPTPGPAARTGTDRPRTAPPDRTDRLLPVRPGRRLLLVLLVLLLPALLCLLPRAQPPGWALAPGAAGPPLRLRHLRPPPQ
ncbi:protein KASH5 [Dromaius novaehollandiae]|uniref:protein KASH5 n=1 Tax=Dromaius novaehollandiae TaxID=8790 RepID=UPI00311EF1B0